MATRRHFASKLKQGVVSDSRLNPKEWEAEALRSSEELRGLRPRLGAVLADVLLVLVIGAGLVSSLAASAWAIVVLYYLK